ncbi:MAG: hypothetical protein CO002_04450 [Candidatus Portnoybacteria bacterium CG_4_8_14_3_um_filter_44_10]|uniref:Uncharacterized protein n=5 Tax=Candidatus Portnoyibacteriota TaxID=1817913 RepID=A0A2M7IER6_9BACT|nr:MAG: hypothetical protein CO002_04450 [Candidatus Portnoybacteria bacterium CG_4_8_14_3_um_filter_44_10]PIZ70065.1 MAG: hypothetical protein COY11_03340 [Candidatus Portnoybacteria bacterium CG_4_10_14_0_2_um_filter_44_20]
MASKEEIIKQLDEEISSKRKQISDSVSKENLEKINSELDQRIFLANNSFLKEVRSLSLISVTAAPFSLTLLLSGLEIEKTLLVVAFVFLIMDVLFLNIGVWYLNSQFKRSTMSQKLEGIIMSSNTTSVLDEKMDNDKWFTALYELRKSEMRLNKKKAMEPYSQMKMLDFFRDCGVMMLGAGLIILIVSVVWSITRFV